VAASYWRAVASAVRQYVDQKKNGVLDDERVLRFIIPSAIHARDAAIKRANPHTVMRAFQFAATMAAAIIVMAAATDLITSRLTLSLLKTRAAQGQQFILDLRCTIDG